LGWGERKGKSFLSILFWFKSEKGLQLGVADALRVWRHSIFQEVILMIK